MLETPHVAVGAAIAAKIPNPYIAIPLAFASHFFLDMTPHWNPHINTEMKKNGKLSRQTKFILIADILLAFIVGSYIAYSKAPLNDFVFYSVMFASLASVMPDVVEAPYFFLNSKSALLQKWIKFQKSIQFDVAPLPGLLTQVIAILASFWWIS